MDTHHKETLLDQTDNEVTHFESTPYGMKCRFPVAKVDEITIAVLPCQKDDEYLGLFLHPAPKDNAQASSRQLYYTSWSFHDSTGSRYELLRLVSLGSDVQHLCFRDKPIVTTWKDIYIMAHPPMTGRRESAHLLQRFHPDVAPRPFWIPRTLMQRMGALEFFPRTEPRSCDAASKDTISLWCENHALMEFVHIVLGTCIKTSAAPERPCHWAWAERRHRTTWPQGWADYAHNCATDHIQDWSDHTQEFGDAERTIRLVFAPCKHAPERTLVLGLELVGTIYEKIQQNANIFLQPRTRVSKTAKL